MEFSEGDIIQVMHQAHDNIAGGMWTSEMLTYQGYIGTIRRIRSDGMIDIGLPLRVRAEWLRRLHVQGSARFTDHYLEGTPVRISLNNRAMGEMTQSLRDLDGTVTTVQAMHGSERVIVDANPRIKLYTHWLHLNAPALQQFFVNELYHYDLSIHCPTVLVQIKVITEEGMFIHDHPDHPSLSRWRLDPARFSKIPPPTAFMLMRHGGDFRYVKLLGRYIREQGIIRYGVTMDARTYWPAGDELFVYTPDNGPLPAIGEKVIIRRDYDSHSVPSGRLNLSPMAAQYVDAMYEFQNQFATVTAQQPENEYVEIDIDGGAHWWHRNWVSTFTHPEL